MRLLGSWENRDLLLTNNTKGWCMKRIFLLCVLGMRRNHFFSHVENVQNVIMRKNGKGYWKRGEIWDLRVGPESKKKVTASSWGLNVKPKLLGFLQPNLCRCLLHGFFCSVPGLNHDHSTGITRKVNSHWHRSVALIKFGSGCKCGHKGGQNCKINRSSNLNRHDFRCVRREFPWSIFLNF